VSRGARFVVVDHSLIGPGNHHFEYCFHIAEAAYDADFQVHIVGHKRMNMRHWPPERFLLHPHFSCTTYQFPDAVKVVQFLQQVHQRVPWTQRLRQRWKCWCSERRISGFQQVLETVFHRTPPSTEDHVFFPTLSAGDFAAVVDFLRQRRVALKGQWHLQVHFEPAELFAAGKESAYETIRYLQETVAALPPQQTFFYCTTKSLAETFNCLGLGEFAELPYPVCVPDPQLRSSLKPLRISVVGHPRRDKGRATLPALVQELWADLFQPGIVQLWLQGGKQKFRNLARTWLRHPTAIRFLPHPLPQAAYYDALMATDIGLFLYDPSTYKRRCSGVLVEMLAAGVPVVVPADTWLAEQIHASPSSTASEPAPCQPRAQLQIDTGTSPAHVPGPYSRVGVAASSVREFADAIREITRNYDQYRSAAFAFAQSWRKEHSFETVLRKLLSRSSN